jgi:hypothetical protein
MSLPSAHQLLRRSFLRLVLVIGLVVTALFSLGTVLVINRFATPTQNARLLSSVSAYEDTLRPMLANADSDLLKGVLAMLTPESWSATASLCSCSRIPQPAWCSG